MAVTFVGTAGWSIPAQYGARFPKTGTHLERYGARLNAAEINTSFYRPHQKKTYERWAASVPKDFRFAVKLPRSITHDGRLQYYDEPLTRFLEEVSGLGAKLGVLLVQLPPSLIYDAATVSRFFRRLAKNRTRIACEPRHPSWFTPKADAALAKLEVARVAADPPRAESDGVPGGWRGFSYWRLHGSPRLYYSNYGAKALKTLADALSADDWCTFDNTMSGAALGNALTVRKLTFA
ncbi:MAG: DUF72 domain-containing protein [Pseudomonadota bacterium]